MNFLGEIFDSQKCKKMCDNCKKGLSVVPMDMQNDSSKIVMFFAAANQASNNFTLPQTIDILRGRKIQSKVPVSSNIISGYSGSLKHLKDDVLRRLLLKMLLVFVLEEKFVNMKAGPISTVVVYL